MTVFCVHFVIDQPRASASGVVRQGRWHGPSTLLGHSPPASQAARRVGPALYSLAFGLIVREAEPQHVVLPLWTIISVSDPDPHCCGSPGSESGTDSSRVGKNPGFFKKTQPSGFFWVFLVFFGFFGFFWVFLGFFARTRGFFQFHEYF
jgi:hypothetical protein